jgi:hypothetical protein
MQQQCRANAAAVTAGKGTHTASTARTQYTSDPVSDPDVTVEPRGAAPSPAPEASAQQVLEHVLDHLSETQELFAGQYRVLHFMARRHGGQGLVQFMRRESDGLDFAVKFFNDQHGACAAAAPALSLSGLSL